jgi:hypothetical protein
MDKRTNEILLIAAAVAVVGLLAIVVYQETKPKDDGLSLEDAIQIVATYYGAGA